MDPRLSLAVIVNLGVTIIGIQPTETLEEIHQMDEKFAGEKAVFDCNTTEIKATLWERSGNNSGVLFTGLRSVRSHDLDNIIISADNYSIILSPIRVPDEGVYTCLLRGTILAEYNLSVKVIPELRIQYKGLNVSQIIVLDEPEDIRLACVAFQSKKGVDLNWKIETTIIQENVGTFNISKNEFMDGTYNIERRIIYRPGSIHVNITCIATNSGNYEDAITVTVGIKRSHSTSAIIPSLTIVFMLLLLTTLSLGVVYHFRARNMKAKKRDKNVQAQSVQYAVLTKIKEDMVQGETRTSNEEYSAIDDEMFDSDRNSDDKISFITRLSKGTVSERWLVTFSSKLGTRKYVFIKPSSEKKPYSRKNQWDSFAKRLLQMSGSPHILSCVGSCILKGHVCLIQTYRPMEMLQDHVMLSAYELQKRLKDDQHALVSELLTYSLQITLGMTFITSNGFSHPTLSIASILLAEDKTCKLFDFCLKDDALCFAERAKATYPSVYQRREFEDLCEYTTATDVWLTAHTIWQIFSQGALPLVAGNGDRKVKSVFLKPELCPTHLYNSLVNCWSEKRSDRPGMKELAANLTKYAIGNQTQ